MNDGGRRLSFNSKWCFGGKFETQEPMLMGDALLFAPNLLNKL